jgi:hypothetical protein
VKNLAENAAILAKKVEMLANAAADEAIFEQILR